MTPPLTCSCPTDGEDWYCALHGKDAEPFDNDDLLDSIATKMGLGDTDD